jgi:hypothetical protein
MTLSWSALSSGARQDARLRSPPKRVLPVSHAVEKQLLPDGNNSQNLDV